MKQLYRTIPLIYSADLPPIVQEELEEWDSELDFHGGNGCVFRIRQRDLKELSQFVAWVVAIGIWTPEQVKLVTYGDYLVINPDGNYKEYEEYLTLGHLDTLVIAMEGT